MAKETTLGKYYRVEDDDLSWVYARSKESGGMFGLELDGNILTTTFLREDHISIGYGKHVSRTIAERNIIKEVAAVEYVASGGDGTSHGATWQHFAQMTRSLDSPAAFQALTDYDRSLELHIDGMQNMALEGANRYGGGWDIIYEGLVDVRDDALAGKGRLQGPLFEGLGWLATNFAERETADSQRLAEVMHSVI